MWFPNGEIKEGLFEGGVFKIEGNKEEIEEFKKQ